MMSDVVDGHFDRAFIAWTAESINNLLLAAWNGRWTTLLQADDVSAEAEAEIARIIARDLLSGDVDFSLEKTSAGSDALKVEVVWVVRGVEDISTGGSKGSISIICDSSRSDCGGGTFFSYRGCQ